MEVVKLRVDVDKKELNQMRADVAQVKSDLKQVSTVFSDGQFVRHIKVANEALGVTRKTVTDFKKDGTHVTETLTKDFEKMAKAAEKAAKKQQQDYEKAEKAMLAAADKSAKQQIALEKKIQQEVEKTRKLREQKTEELIKQGQTAQNANSAKNASTWSQKLSDNIKKFTEWYVVGNIIGGLRRSLQSALDTMREVDSQLVVVRKVTGMQGAELKALEEQAYKTATAYGVSADAYLQSVAAFSRAGYGDQAAALAELSTKTQIVGDTTADVANQFLLSVDAAYKYKGSITELTKVLDGANEIDNKYATSIEKIAEGMGIVAPVAAQAHVTISELTAAIGTITAVTQRSGSEAARAFRALVLNIIGDTKTEIDEGVTWTTGEIAGLKDVIKQYAPEAYKAAQATGAVIDPMEAIGGLAQSMKDGLLTEAQLMEMVSDIGGKLRTSQLLALIENWDMYKSMMEDFAGAVGSADREVENALNSWERKTQILSNTWTEFISHLINTDAIKSALDVITGAVKLLDTGFGRAVVTLVAFSTIIGLITKAKTSLVAAIKMAAIAKTQGAVATAALSAADKEAAIASLGLGEAIKILTKAMLTNPLFIAGAALAGIYGLVTLIKEFTFTTQKAVEKIDEAKNTISEAENELDSINEKIKKNNELIEKNRQLNTDAANVRIKGLEGENDLLEHKARLLRHTIELQKQEAAEAAKKGLTVVRGYDPLDGGSQDSGYFDINPSTIGADGTSGSYWDYEPEQGPSGNILGRAKYLLNYYDPEKVSGELSDVISTIITLREELDLTDSSSAALASEIDNNILPAYDAWVNELYGTTDAQAEAVEQTEIMAQRVSDLQERMESLNSQIDDLQGALSTLTAAQEEYNTYGSVSVDTVQKLLALDAEYLNALFDENGALNLNSEAVAGLLTDKSKLLEALAAEAVATYAAEEAARLGASATETAGNAAQTATGKIETAAAAAIRSGQDAATGAAGWTALAGAIASVYGGTVKGNNLKTLQSNVIAYANNVRNLIASAGSGLGVWTGANYKGSSGSGGSGSSPEKEALTAQKKQAELEKKQMQKQRDEEIAAVDEQIEQLKAQHKAQEDANKLAELQLAVEEAELALMNAQNERTVRYYNEATGQWEWIANNTDVLKAEQEMEDARQKLADEEAQRAYEAQIAVLEEQKEGLKIYWENAIARLDDTIDILVEKLSNLKTTVNTTINLGDLGGQQKQTEVKTTVEPTTTITKPSSLRRDKVQTLFGTAPVTGNTPGTYDSGGVLHGLGGIKATQDDEIVLPPHITKRMLAPAANSAFTKRLRELGYLYGEKENMPSIAGSTWNKIGSQHNGNVYQFGGISISEQKAATMTVLEFAKMSRNLGMYRWDN